MPHRLGPFFDELKRRKVIRAALMYVVVGLAVIEGADLILDPLQLGWLYPAVVVLTLLFFPIAMVLAWAFDLTPRGVEPTAPADVGAGAWAPAESRPAKASPGDDSLPLPTGPVIAVLPLTNLGGTPDDDFFTDGITEDLITALARFTNLFVIARNSTARYKGVPVDVRQLREELGARYVLEGGVRRSAAHLRVNVQLLDTSTGTHLWAETYDRDLTAGEIFAVQDDISDRIVATLADSGGVLARSGLTEVRRRPTESLDAYEAVLKAYSYWERQAPAEHAEVREALEGAVEQDPAYAHAWACLAILYLDEFRVAFNPRPDPLGRALEAAEQAVRLDPTNSFVQDALAQTHFYRKDLDSFFRSVDRAVRLNPNDATTAAMLGLLRAYAGDWDEGICLIERAMALNPHHPGWYHFAAAADHYRRREYERALEAGKRVDMPGYYPYHMWLAAIYGQLGRQREAESSLEHLLALFPGYVELARENIGMWLVSPEMQAHVLEGLRKAGLELPGDGT